MRARGTKQGRRIGSDTISARLNSRVTLQASPSGEIAAWLDGYAIALGPFNAGIADPAQALRSGLLLSSFASGRRIADKEIARLVRRLALHGLLEYRLSDPQSGADLAVIEPQVAEYWPAIPKLGDDEFLVLSRFAYARRRGNDMVIESPRAGALFKLCHPKIAATLALLSTAQQVGPLCKHAAFPGRELLALLLDCGILFKVESGGSGLRPSEGDDSLVLWDFHDLLFHARSTEGRHANPLGGIFHYADTVAPLPAVRPRWPGKKISLGKPAPADALPAAAKLMRRRHSARTFDDRRPITLAELAQFLDATARVLSRSDHEVDPGDGGHTVRPYPSAGAAYELELYLTVSRCAGLARGFYHYDAGAHALVPIAAAANDVQAMLLRAQGAMGAAAVPQVLITTAARFGRISWKYSSIAYSLILRDVGVLMQSFYLMAVDMGLGGCAIGISNIDLFAKMTAIDFHVEGPVGQFALGRGEASAENTPPVY
jgi:SagB-type dehydrogenase family enzyme